MKQFGYNILFAGLVTASLLSAPVPASAIGVGSSVSDAASATDQSDGLSLNLKAGQVLEMTFVNRKHGRQAREAQQFFDKAVRPFTSRHGQDFLGQMGIDDAILGGLKPSSVEFFGYRNADFRDQLTATKAWDDVRSYRKNGWKRIDTFSTTLAEDLDIRFDPAKSYTLAIAWANPAHPEAYDAYLDGVATEFDKVGARFVHKFRDLDFEDWTGERAVPPLQITLVEWNDEAGLSKLLSSEAYKTHRPNFRKGVSDFRFYRLK